MLSAIQCISAFQGHPRSLILAPIERAYWLKIVNFPTHSHLTPSLEMNPFDFLDELFTAKTRVLGLSVGEDFVILACVVLAQ